MQYCTKCGSQVTDDVKFCKDCGTKIESDDSNFIKNESNGEQPILFNHNGITVDLKELIQKHGSDKIGALQELRERTHVDLKLGKNVIDAALAGKNYEIGDKTKSKIGCLTIFLWVFFFPIMIGVLIIKNKKMSKLAKAASLLAYICILVALGASSSNGTAANSSTKTSVSQTSSAAKSADTIDKNIKLIMDKTSLTKSESEELFKVLKSVGFTSITEITKTTGTGVDELQAFKTVCDGVTTLVLVEKRKTTFVGVGDINLFAIQKGVIGNINDYLLTDRERISFITTSEEIVKKALKAPSTAKFPGQLVDADKWNVAREKNVVQVLSYVDSQNSFGAMIRSEFDAEYNYKTGELLYLAIDGKSIYGKAPKVK